VRQVKTRGWMGDVTLRFPRVLGEPNRWRQQCASTMGFSWDFRVMTSKSESNTLKNPIKHPIKSPDMKVIRNRSPAIRPSFITQQ